MISAPGRFRVIVLALGLFLSATACGKVGPPLPPVPRPVARPGVAAATQVGDRVRIAWQAPNLDLRKSVDSSVSRADIYRLIQSRDETTPPFVDQFVESGAEVVGFLDYGTLENQLSKNADRVLLYEDTLDLSEPSALANRRFVYAVRYVDRLGRPLSWSNIIGVEPVPGIAMPPASLTYEEHQDEIVLSWVSPQRNIDGSSPAQVVGYNVYRAGADSERLGEPLNKRLLTETTYVDSSFQYLKPYSYVVRSVSQGPDSQVESVNSMPLAVTPRDVFPPATPTNVTIASAAGIVSLFWPANAERDLKGYLIYRAEGDGGAFVRITPEPVTRTSYRDDRTRTGTRYAYKLSAVDRYGNESAPTSPVYEVASP